MITIILILILVKAFQMRKAWNYSKALFDKEYIKHELFDFAKMLITVLLIWALIEFDIVVILIKTL